MNRVVVYILWYVCEVNVHVFDSKTRCVVQLRAVASGGAQLIRICNSHFVHRITIGSASAGN